MPEIYKSETCSLWGTVVTVVTKKTFFIYKKKLLTKKICLRDSSYSNDSSDSSDNSDNSDSSDSSDKTL